MTELAKAEQISVQSMGATLGALEARGLVERCPHPSDGRRSVLSITPAGARVLGDKHNGRAEQLAKALSSGFSPAELRRADGGRPPDRAAGAEPVTAGPAARRRRWR